MDNPIRFLFEKLTERIFGIIGSNIGTSLSTCRAACEAEQQNLLEDLARKYEAEGKQKLADQLRLQAARITGTDPASDGAHVLETLGATQNLIELQQDEVEVPRKRRRKGRSALSGTTPAEDDPAGNSATGGA